MTDTDLANVLLNAEASEPVPSLEGTPKKPVLGDKIEREAAIESIQRSIQNLVKHVAANVESFKVVYVTHVILSFFLKEDTGMGKEVKIKLYKVPCVEGIGSAMFEAIMEFYWDNDTIHLAFDGMHTSIRDLDSGIEIPVPMSS